MPIDTWKKVGMAALGAALLVAAPRALASAPAVTSVSVSSDLSVVDLSGEFGPGAVKVTVGGQTVQVLTNDGTYVSAKLPAGFQAGTYHVIVTLADGRSTSLDANLQPTTGSP